MYNILNHLSFFFSLPFPFSCIHYQVSIPPLTTILYILFQIIRFLSVTQLNLSLLFIPYFFTFYSSSDFGFYCPQAAIKKLRFLNPTSPSILFPLSLPPSIPPFLPISQITFSHISLSCFYFPLTLLPLSIFPVSELLMGCCGHK